MSAGPAPPPEMISLGLSRITQLLTHLRSPHARTPVVHVAGTNGKGSVSAYLAAILDAADLAVGRFNSPHLVDECDSVRIRERVVDLAVFATAKAEVERVNAQEALAATPFEVLTATAFSLFARSHLDLAIVEVGMGGESDATNVVPPAQTLVSVLTAVDLDHQGFLGDTVHAIARVKSGIVRQGGDLVVAHQAYPEVIDTARSVAHARGATVWQAGRGRYSTNDAAPTGPDTPRQALIPLSPARVDPPASASAREAKPLLVNLPLPGSYQLDNSATATLTAQLLRTLPRARSIVPRLASISDDAIKAGIEQTRWDGRLQWLDYSPIPRHVSSTERSSASQPRSRRILLDGAHNPSSAALLGSYLASLPPSARPNTLIFGLSAPRAASDVLGPLLDRSTGIEKVVCVEFSPPVGMPWVRATPSDELERAVSEMNVENVVVERYRSVEEAFSRLSESRATTVVAGSLYLVADTLRLVYKGERR
ncbi:hypothetical protein JCM11491_006161 [Sporobolomyces phaffii]